MLQLIGALNIRFQINVVRIALRRTISAVPISVVCKSIVFNRIFINVFATYIVDIVRVTTIIIIITIVITITDVVVITLSLLTGVIVTRCAVGNIDTTVTIAIQTNSSANIIGICITCVIV